MLRSKAEMQDIIRYAKGLEDGLHRFAQAMAVGIREEKRLREAIRLALVEIGPLKPSLEDINNARNILMDAIDTQP